MRSYRMMRDVLAAVAGSPGGCGLDELQALQPWDDMFGEVRRLAADGLIESSVEFVQVESELAWKCGRVSGLTAEGREFYRLVESEGVWEIVRETLGKAGVDVSYPLLKEVCEEIVKRYVTSFIPDI